MPFNEKDYTKAPWVSGCMTLTNEECVEVKENINDIVEEFEPDNYTPYPTEMYIISTYNELDWSKAINAETYTTISAYNPEYNTQGIDENGIIPEPVEEPEEETPTEPEEPTEEEAPAGEDQPEEEAPVEEEQPETMAEEITAEEEK